MDGGTLWSPDLEPVDPQELRAGVRAQCALFLLSYYDDAQQVFAYFPGDTQQPSNDSVSMWGVVGLIKCWGSSRSSYVGLRAYFMDKVRTGTLVGVHRIKVWAVMEAAGAPVQARGLLLCVRRLDGFYRSQPCLVRNT